MFYHNIIFEIIKIMSIYLYNFSLYDKGIILITKEPV